MRNRAFWLSRRAMLAAGAVAAGALAGCQSTGSQFSQPGVARGDQGRGPMSPAFAQVAAGQQLAGGSGRMAPANMGMAPGTMGTGMPVNSYPSAGQNQMVLGSGGMVHPVAYSSAGPVSLPLQGQAMMSPGTMVPGTMSMPVNNGTTMSGPIVYSQQPYPPQVYSQQPVPAAPAMAPTTLAPGQTLLLVNGPNGPQYIIAEMAGSAPATPVMTAPTPTPAPQPAPEPAPPPAPTFSAPPPAVVPPPSMPALPTPTEAGARKPDPLPPSVSAKPPTGPVLPVANTSGPSLGSFPAAPAVTPAAGPKLPPPTAAATDDYIPAAPVFTPPGR